jgi:hypothetical protein
MKSKIIAVWICTIYFAVVFYNNLGFVIFGTLGVVRPSDTTNGMIEVTRANELIQSFAAPLQRLTLLVGLGVLLLFCVASWFTAKPVIIGHRKNESA